MHSSFYLPLLSFNFEKKALKSFGFFGTPSETEALGLGIHFKNPKQTKTKHINNPPHT